MSPTFALDPALAASLALRNCSGMALTTAPDKKGEDRQRRGRNDRQRKDEQSPMVRKGKRKNSGPSPGEPREEPSPVKVKKKRWLKRGASEKRTVFERQSFRPKQLNDQRDPIRSPSSKRSEGGHQV